MKNISLEWFLSTIGTTIVLIVSFAFTLNGDVSDIRQTVKVNTVKIEQYEHNYEKLETLVKENDIRTQEKLDYIIEELNKKQDK